MIREIDFSRFANYLLAKVTELAWRNSRDGETRLCRSDLRLNLFCVSCFSGWIKRFSDLIIYLQVHINVVPPKHNAREMKRNGLY